jgi:hypothetical protein
MSTQFYVSGPCYSWVGLGPTNAYLFLGYSEAGVTVRLTQMTEDINVDYAGVMPGDVSLLGEDWRSAGTFTRYDETVMQKVMSFKGPNGIAGFGSNNILGSLMNLEGLSFPLLLYSPYSFKNQYASSVPGFNISNAIFDDTSERTNSIRRTAPTCNFRALPVFGTTTGSSFQPNVAPFNGYDLYSTLWNGQTVWNPATLPATT